MDWTRQLNAYCERLGPGFWAEPVNAVTNLAFIVAAGVGWRLFTRRGGDDLAIAWLVVVVTAVGIGSFLFHTVATVWAAMADVLPITLFILSYLALVLRRGFALPWWAALALTVAFLPVSTAVEAGVGTAVGDALGGSEGYLPALAALVVCGGWLRARHHALGVPLLAAAGLFALSLTFRTLDMPLCPVFPLGTHFLWHLLNGVLLGWLIVSLARHGRPAVSAA
ncbi:MAG: ceramidase domain-containing protein [Alphaproteobacteria bacterium]